MQRSKYARRPASQSTGHTLISEHPPPPHFVLVKTCQSTEIYVYWLYYCVASFNRYLMLINHPTDGATRGLTLRVCLLGRKKRKLKLSAQRFRYALFAFIHTQTYFEYYTLTLRLASLVKKAVIYAYWTKELFDICRENVSYMATLPSVARHVIHADNLRPRQ